MKQDSRQTNKQKHKCLHTPTSCDLLHPGVAFHRPGCSAENHTTLLIIKYLSITNSLFDFVIDGVIDENAIYHTSHALINKAHTQKRDRVIEIYEHHEFFVMAITYYYTIPVPAGYPFQTPMCHHS